MKKKASKRYKKLIDTFKDKKLVTLEETIKKVKQSCTAKFDESIDVSLNLNLIKKKEEVSLRTVVNLPYGNGKKSFDDKKIIDNFSALIQTIQKVKPNGVKGDFILSSFITSTMSISHKIKVKT